MLKKHQNNELERFSKEKQALQEKAETLAEKYEDTKEKQDLLRKRYVFCLFVFGFGFIEFAYFILDVKSCCFC